MAEQAVIAAPARVSETPARAPKVRVRRNVRWLAAGILAVALGGLGTWALFSTAADTRPALKLNKTLYRGQVITASDLSVVALGKNADIAAVSGNELNNVVGKSAITDLPAGSLLVQNSFGAPELASGLARVGLKVEAGRMPATNLKPGTLMVVVSLPAGAGASTNSLPGSVDATLATAPTQATDGSYVVDLNVRIADAEQVARLGAMKQVALMQKAEG